MALSLTADHSLGIEIAADAAGLTGRWLPRDLPAPSSPHRALITDAPASSGEATWLPDGRLVFLVLGTTPALAWLDPKHPAAMYGIDVGAGTPGHPAAIRP